MQAQVFAFGNSIVFEIKYITLTVAFAPAMADFFRSTQQAHWVMSAATLQAKRAQCLIAAKELGLSRGVAVDIIADTISDKKVGDSSVKVEQASAMATSPRPADAGEAAGVPMSVKSEAMCRTPPYQDGGSKRVAASMRSVPTPSPMMLATPHIGAKRSLPQATPMSVVNAAAPLKETNPPAAATMTPCKSEFSFSVGDCVAYEHYHVNKLRKVCVDMGYLDALCSRQSYTFGDTCCPSACLLVRMQSM